MASAHGLSNASLLGPHTCNTSTQKVDYSRSHMPAPAPFALSSRQPQQASTTTNYSSYTTTKFPVPKALQLFTALASTITRLSPVTMSCPLDKLAPETRIMIYEYVLSFDTPLKHVTKMQPFVKKLTGVEPKSGSHHTGSETETATKPQLVNTSILTASKLIYAEAIAVFYALNTIHFNAQLFNFKILVSPHATDLSLARHVVMEIDDKLYPDVFAGHAKAMLLSLDTIQAIFPKLRTCNVYASTDAQPQSLICLFTFYSGMCRSHVFKDVHFDGVGSFTASWTRVPCLKLILQSRRTVDCWAKPTEIPVTLAHWIEVPANTLYQASRADSQNDFGRAAQALFDLYKKHSSTTELEDVDQDGYEYWTAVAACKDVCDEPGA